MPSALQLSEILHSGVGFRWRQPVQTTIFEITRRGGLFSQKGPYMYLSGKIGPMGASLYWEDGVGEPYFTGRMGPGGPNKGGLQKFMTPVPAPRNNAKRAVTVTIKVCLDYL